MYSLGWPLVVVHRGVTWINEFLIESNIWKMNFFLKKMRRIWLAHNLISISTYALYHIHKTEM